MVDGKGMELFCIRTVNYSTGSMGFHSCGSMRHRCPSHKQQEGIVEIVRCVFDISCAES